jgi:hypothetical protein
VASVFVCETCRDEVHPDSEPGIVYAVELELVQTPQGIAYLEGRGVFFHATCFPEESDRWREKPMPIASEGRVDRVGEGELADE